MLKIYALVTDFGAIAWKNYPTLRAMMEMCITNQFLFPPPTLASGEQVEEIRAKEIQTATMEKQDILQFEIHLAAATSKQTITESNSLLLSTLITNNPEGKSYFYYLPNPPIYKSATYLLEDSTHSLTFSRFYIKLLDDFFSR